MAEWRSAMEAKLTGSQDKEGPTAGSWFSVEDAWNQQLGRLGLTSLCLMTLEVGQEQYAEVDVCGSLSFADSEELKKPRHTNFAPTPAEKSPPQRHSDTRAATPRHSAKSGFRLPAIRTETRLAGRIVKAVTVGEIVLLYTDFEGTTVEPSGNISRHSVTKRLRSFSTLFKELIMSKSTQPIPPGTKT